KADLMIVAAIILVAKVISAIADFVIGNIIDRSNFKSGKMRPFILFSALPIAVLTTLMFIYIPFKTMAGMYVYITITTVLWNVAMSFADIPSQGMLALLSPKSSERNACAGIANTLKSIGLAAPGLVVPVICAITKSDVIGKTEYLISTLFFSILGIALYILIYFFNKEAVPSKSNRMTFREMGKELKTNKMLLIVFLTYMLGFGRNMAMGIGVQAAAVFIRDGVDIWIGSFHYAAAGENLPWLIGLTSAVSSMISILVVPFINKKWGEKKTFIVFAIYGFAMTTISFILYVTGVQAFRSLWAILVYQFLVGFSFGPHGYLPMIMVSDIVDYREWQTGVRTEGTQFAVLSLSNKISNALSVAIGIFIVGAAGYQGGMHGSQISDAMQNTVFAAYLFIPGICMLLSMIPMFWYKIDFKTKETMHRELVERRGELSDDFLESESETQNDAERATNDVNENAETTASEANIENSVAADSQSDETQDNE
ncbi:MAG: MFS transporter, partial [Acidaminococcus sp.]|nr:MFS transporter [Acidaminococcus sp.]